MTGSEGSATRWCVKVDRHGSLASVVACLLGITCPAAAIEVNPTPAQIQVALDRGKSSAAEHLSPDRFYARFGGAASLQPTGFLLTKLGGLSVLAAHMARRGREPSPADIAQVIEASTMLVSAIIFGDSPSFGVNSYLALDQGGRVIKPVTVRADGQASRTKAWPESPKFQAKVVAIFSYPDLDPHAQTTITVFPASGGEVHFQLNFAEIE